MKRYNAAIAAGLLSGLIATVVAGQGLLILAPDEFLDELRPLEHFKNATCRPAILLGLNQVYAEFSGVDKAEEVKLCIAHYQQVSGVKDVLLVGGVARFPVRWRWWGRWMPNDPYFQGNWKVVNGQYEQSDPTIPYKSNLFGSWIDIGAYTQYTVDVDVIRLAGNQARVLFADADRAAGTCRIELSDKKLILCLCGVASDVDYTFSLNKTYHMKIMLTGTQVQVYVDGTLQKNLPLGPHQLIQPGKVGVGTFEGSARFDNFQVRSASGTLLYDEDFNDGIANGFTDALNMEERGWAPSELYYADLFKTGTYTFDNWNSNGNGLFAEIEFKLATYCPTCTINNDHIDYLTDVSVGRVPASTGEEVTRYVNKVIAYELTASPAASWFRQAVLYEGSTGGGSTNDSIATFLSGQGFTVSNRHWVDDLGDLTPEQRKDIVVSNLNAGAGLMNYLGHGNYDAWQCMNFTSEDAKKLLSNSTMLPIIFAGACLTGRFTNLPPTERYTDINNQEHPGNEECELFPGTSASPDPVQLNRDAECIAKELLFNSGNSPGSAGAIAYFGESRVGRNWANQLSEYFFKAYAEGKALGDMWRKSIEDYYWANNLDQSYSWNYGPEMWDEGHKFDEPQKFVLFGDPSVVVGGAFCASLSGTQYDWTWPAIGPLYPFSRHRISGDVIVPVGQRLTAQYYHSFLFESGRKITALDSNISNGFIVNALANSPVSFIAISADPQADHFMRGAKVTGQMRLRNGGAIRLLAGP